MDTSIIARHLNIAQKTIIRVEEWANVIFVVAKKIGARFVSKKVVNKLPQRITYNYPTGEKVEVNLLSKQWLRSRGFDPSADRYEIKVDGKFHRRLIAEVVLAGFDALTPEQKQEIDFIFS